MEGDIAVLDASRLGSRDGSNMYSALSLAGAPAVETILRREADANGVTECPLADHYEQRAARTDPTSQE